ncbi:MAG: CpsB/CapC family capsule biosynthesis tyrosine phosphatase [Anaerolineae bacterium]|nr:capsular biosynthesis protein [Anaerolineae bacterium]MDW8102654.1 CpsB/CapC family capsule biosynthesis tyrosine phosphatase [Anaerolineae bacterium]
MAHEVKGFVDIHIHILPGIDDGPEDWEEAIQMAKAAQEDGIAAVVATPHNIGFGQELNRNQILLLVEELKGKLLKEGVALQIFPGIEVLLVPEVLLLLEEGKAFTLNGSRYILVELPYAFYPVYSEYALFKLLERGYRPILAHPERYAYFQSRPELLKPLVKMGVLVQLTSSSITGELGGRAKETSRFFLQEGMAHIIATDAHSPRWRKPTMREAFEEVSCVLGQEKAMEMFFFNPKAILEDEEIKI